MHNNKSVKLFKYFFPILLTLILWNFHVENAHSQEISSIPDSIYHNPNLPVSDQDTLIPLQYREISPDTLVQDTIKVNENDTLPALQPSSRQSNFLASQVEYNAIDSIVYYVTEQKFYLWREAYVKYETLELRADYIEIDMDRNEVFATGLTDSLGNVTGRPVMTEGAETFEAETMRYNFQTKKGIITGIVTEQQDGFLHGNKTKKHENDHLHIHGGKYTTCDLDHPHYYIALTRAKVIPDDKVISGPAYLVIEDIPLPVAVPFGFFPNKPERKSGILFPTYGEEASRGFFLRNGGYYLHLNEYMDLRLMGDVYSLGSWSVNAASNYSRRYRFNGSFRYAYSYNVAGERGLANYMENTSYNIAWQHRQDAKASPNSNFTASVNFGSSSFNRLNSIVPDVTATSTAQSSISFSQRWPDSPFSLTSNVSANQNFSDNSVTVRLPSVNFNMARQYPFRSAERVGDYRWYENIELSYSSSLDNRINTQDTLLFRKETLGNMESGFRHEVPLRANFRLFNLLNITPGISYSGVMYTSQIRKNWVEDAVNPNTGETGPGTIIDTIPGIVYGHAINPNFSTSLSQNIYGMFTFRNSKVEAIRHVITPSVGFSFIPDMGGINPDYYRTVQGNEQGRIDEYSIFEGQMYGTPSVSGRSGNVSFGLLNNLEMKVRDQRDTINQSRKIAILERLNFSTSYNIYADSLNWSVINMTGSTSLFENKVRISFNAIMDPYALDENNRRYNSFQWSNNRTPGRITRAGLSLTMGLRSAATERPAGSEMGQEATLIPPDGTALPRLDAHGEILPGEEDIFSHLDDVAHEVYYYGDYVDFSVPWNLNVRYNLNYTKPQRDSRINQTLNFSGDLSLTPKWKIQFTSGFDFEANEFTPTNINIHRDLHCWEMRFGVVPFGTLKSWNFSIAVKSSLLKDLKYRTTRSWYDNFFR